MKIGNLLLFVFLQIWWFILKIRNNVLSTLAINTYDYHGNNLCKSKNKGIIIPIIWIQEFFDFLAFTDTWDYHLVCVIKLHKVIFFQKEKYCLGQRTFASPKIVGCYGCMESFRDFFADVSYNHDISLVQAYYFKWGHDVEIKLKVSSFYYLRTSASIMK